MKHQNSTKVINEKLSGSKTKHDLNSHFEKYISECISIQQLRPETLRGYKEVFKNFLKLMPEVIDSSRLSTEILSLFFERLNTRSRVVGKDTVKIGVKVSTIKTYWSKLNSFFEWLYARQLIKENPLAKIRPPEPIYDDKRALTMSDVHKIISAITLHSQNAFILKRDITMISLLLYCGIRRGELVSLHCGDIDLEKGLLTVRGETSKSKRTRTIPVHPTLALHLKDYINERNKRGNKTEYLLASSGNDRGLSRDGLKHWVNRLNQLSGVSFHLHRFRHTFACNLANKNVSVIKIQKLMGHTDLRMTERYMRSLSVEDMRADINALGVDI